MALGTALMRLVAAQLGNMRLLSFARNDKESNDNYFGGLI
jgi:hypothetical protein